MKKFNSFMWLRGYGLKRVGRILACLTLLLTLVCGNAWGAESATNNPATVSYGTGGAAKTFLDVANTVSNCTISSGSVACVTYGLYEMDKNWKPAFYSGPANGSSSSYDYASASTYGFMAGSSAGTGTAANKSATSGYGAAKYTSSAEGVIYVTGITGIAVMGKDNNTSDNKRLYIKVEEYAADGTCTAVGTDGITESSYNKSLHITTYDDGTLSGTKYYKITLTSGNTSNCETSQIRFTKYIATPACGETAQAALTLSSNSGTICGTGSTTFTVSGGSGTGALSVSSSDETKATASIDGSTVTVTGVAAGSATITVTKACDATYAEKTATYSATVAAVPTANAGADKVTEPSTGVALAATAAADGCTGAWTIVSGPNTATSQLSSTSSATATFTPTAAGTYTLRWTVTNTSSSCTAYDEMTVSAAVCSISSCGNATITYPLNVGTSLINTAANLVNTPSNGGSAALTVPAASAAVTLSTITISEKDGKKDNYGKAAAATSACYPTTAPTMSSKIGMYNGLSYSSSNYLQFAFTVNSGYTFTPCDIQFTVQPVSNEASFRWEVTDGTNIYGYGTGSAGVGSSAGATVLTGLTSTSEMDAGTYYIRLYPYVNAASKTFRISNNVILKGTTASSCTAPTAVYVTQTAGSSDMVAGESFTLSAATSTGVEEGATYQWYRNSTEVGTSSPTYTVPSCTKVDAGTYWCKITNPCSSDAHTTNTVGYGIKVWQVLLYESSKWNSYDLTSTGTKTGRMSRQLAPGTYYIKLTHNNGVDFGVNTGETISEISATTPSPWTLYGSQNNIKLTVTTAGEYTFDVNYTSADYPTLSVTYPPSTISSCDKIYFCPTVNSIATGSAKFSIYFYNATTNAWANCYLVSGTEYADDAKYVAFAPSTATGWTGMIVVRYSSYISNWDNKWNQSEDITYNGYNYIVGRNEWTSDKPEKFKTHLNSFYSSTTPAMSAASYATTVDGTTNASTNLTGATISYASDDPSVATVNSSGVITGVAAGETTITASVGLCTVGSATVTISKNTPTQFTVSGTTSICSGDNTNITLSGSQTGASYQLKKGGVNEGEPKAGTGSSLTWSVSAAGTYTVSAVETAKYAALDMTGNATVSSKTATSVSFSDYTLDATEGESFEITGISAAGSGTLTYQWYSYTDAEGSGEDDIDGATSDTYTFTPASAGDYYFKCKVTGDCGSVKSDMITVTAATACSTPADPDGLAAGSISSSGVTFTITDDESPASYEIYYSTSSTDPTGSTVASATTTSTTKSVTGLTANTTYYAWVRAVCNDDYKSDWVALTGSTFTTLAAGTKYYLFTPTKNAEPAHTGTLSGQFRCATSTPANNSQTIDGHSMSHWCKFSTQTSLSGGTYYHGKTFIAYDIKTNSTDFTLYFYNNASAAKDIYYALIQEGITSAPTPVKVGTATANSTGKATFTITASKNTRILFYTEDQTNMRCHQIVAEESGSALPKPGESGYKVGFKGTYSRFTDYSEGTNKQGILDDSVKVVCYSNYSMGTADALKIHTSGTDYISFRTGASACQVKVCVSSSKTYYLGTSKSATTNAQTGTYTFALAANTRYYINPNGNDVTVDSIVFLPAPSGYTVTYEDGGATSGSVPVDSNSPYEEDDEVTVLGNTGSLAKNGYTFAGWSDGSTDYEAGDKFDMPAEDVTLTAQWTPNTYDITYNLNGASWAGGYSAPANYTVGTGATLPLAGNMTNTGYTFRGWYDNSGLTGSSITAISTSDYGNKEYWAKWTENEYTITYDANNVSATGSTSDTEGHYVTVADCGFELDGHMFAGWNTKSDGTGDPYSAGDEIELTANMTLYAQWGDDYTISWDASANLNGVAATPNLGGGNYTITASVADWTGTLTTSMISALTDGVTITNVAVENSSSPKTITATFNVGASVAGESISFELDVPAAGDFGAKSSTKDIDIDRCTGSSSGSDGVLFSAEFKDSGLGTSNICDAANTAFTFTTDQLKSAAVGGSIKAYSTDNLNHMKYATNAISIAGSDGVIEITLDNAIATNDLFTYLNVNSSSSAAYLRHTSADNTTDQIALTVYNSKEAKVRLTSGFNGKTTLYVVRNNKNFNLHKAAVVRPSFLMLLDDSKSAANLEGTNVEMTTSTYLSTITGGRVYFTSPSSGNLKIKTSNSKNYIQFNNVAGYVKVVLNDALQEGDVIGFDSYNTNNLAFTATAERSTTITTTNQLYTVTSSSALKGQTTFYIWQYSGSSDFLRGLQIARSGVAGGSGGSDQITPTLTWTPALESDADWDGTNSRLAKETGDADFTFTVTQDKNSLGAITYASSNTSVATVTSAGKVHIVGAGEATITATMAESGCYEEATAEYDIYVVDNCEDAAGTITVKDLGCATGYELTVSGHTIGDAVTYQWYKDGVSMGGSYVAAKCTVTVAGEYYVVVDNTGSAGSYHCAMASTNTITIEATEAATASAIVDEWYIKNGRRTPDIALVQTENATDFTVKSGSTEIWNSDGSVTTGFAGCGFYLGTDGIIYLKGQKADGTAPSGLTAGDEALTFIATSCGGNADDVEITIHKQAATTRPSVAFVVDGTKEGDFDAENEDHSVGTALYDYLDYTRNGSGADGLFDLTPQNVYSTVDEKAIRQHYSQFDAIIITDDPSTSTKIGKKSCVDAFGTMVDIRPILTMEAYVSSLANWKAKGISGNPTSPNPRQYAMKLECKDHAIFSGLDPASDNVEVETVDGVDYWTVTMVDKTKTPYDGLDDDEETGGAEKPALQGFSASNVDGLLLLGEISEGTLYTGVERQDEPAARLMLLGVQYKALPSALTPEGLIVIKNALNYLLETDMEEVDDCSNYFTDATGDHLWSTNGNWSKGKAPDVTVKARILKPCIITGTAYAAQVDIATGGKSSKGGGIAECTGKLTIDPTGALIVGGEVRAAEAPYFNTGELKPTTANNLVLNTNGSNQSALIFNNDKGDTKATVNLYSLGRKPSSYLYQYFAIPMESLPVNPTFANETHGGTKIYTYAWEEGTSSWTRRKYYDDLYAFEGLGITTNSTADYMSYTMTGNLASTAERVVMLTYDGVGLNLIGNSWMAPIQIGALAEDNAGLDNQTAYIYCAGRDAVEGAATSGVTETAGQWIAIPFEAAEFETWKATGKLSVIPAMQAFQIKVAAEATLTLDYDKVVRGSTNDLNAKLRAPGRRMAANEVTMTNIRVADSKTHTDLSLFEGDRFSEAFDNGWEAEYMNGDGRSAKLYAETEAGQMAVVAMYDYEGTVVGFAPGQETEYTFSFMGEDNGYYLNDIKLQNSVRISEGETYTFTYEEGDAANRFYISRTAINAPEVATGMENLDAAVPRVQKIIYNDKLYIIRGGRLYDATGKVVK